MKGYLLPDNPGVLVPPARCTAGWRYRRHRRHDDEGFIRFMPARVSPRSARDGVLTAVEQLASAAWPEAHHAAVGLPEAKKGEQVILLTTQRDASPKHLAEASPGVASINLPKKVFVVEKVPVLPTGKTDYIAATQLADSLLMAEN